MTDEGGEVTGKIDFRIRQDFAKTCGFNMYGFKRVWLMGFKGCIDFLIIELARVGETKAAAILEEVRRVSWPS